MNRLLLTGAAGGLGTMLRQKLAGYVPNLRVSDIADLGPAGPGEEVVQCDLADRQAVHDLVAGCDGIIHLGGISNEKPFDAILEANFLGTYNVFEASRKHGGPRIIFASSNHAIGFHTRETALDGASAMRPDSIYGLSKCYGELLGSLYFDKFGVENVAVRIGSCFPKPTNRRAMATWLSYDDFTRLIKAIFNAERVAHTMVYGASANREQWWDNRHAAFLGWVPQDSAEDYRAEVEAAHPLQDANHPEVKFQGGGFAASGHFED